MWVLLKKHIIMLIVQLFIYFCSRLVFVPESVTCVCCTENKVLVYWISHVCKFVEIRIFYLDKCVQGQHCTSVYGTQTYLTIFTINNIRNKLSTLVINSLKTCIFTHFPSQFNLKFTINKLFYKLHYANQLSIRMCYRK